MSMVTESKKTKMPFIKAYRSIIKDPNLSPAEKLMLVAICAYWPKQKHSTQTNKTLAGVCGITERYTEMLIASLKRKQRIKIEYLHITRNGKSYTVRGIVPIAPTNQRIRIPNNPSVIIPNNPSGDNRTILRNHTEQSFDLLERDKKYNRKATPTPSPLKQAPALLNKKIPKARLTETEFEQRRQQQIKQIKQEEIKT